MRQNQAQLTADYVRAIIAASLREVADDMVSDAEFDSTIIQTERHIAHIDKD